MKNLFLTAILLLFISSGCKKVRTCECITIQNGYSVKTDNKTAKLKKGDAKSRCEENNGISTIDTLGLVYTQFVSCNLK